MPYSHAKQHGSALINGLLAIKIIASTSIITPLTASNYSTARSIEDSSWKTATPGSSYKNIDAASQT